MGAELRGSGAAGMSTQGEDSACLSEECDEEAGGAGGGGRRERRGQGCTGSSPGTGPAVLGLQEAPGGVKPQGQFPGLPGKPMVGA